MPGKRVRSASGDPASTRPRVTIAAPAGLSQGSRGQSSSLRVPWREVGDDLVPFHDRDGRGDGAERLSHRLVVDLGDLADGRCGGHAAGGVDEVGGARDAVARRPLEPPAREVRERADADEQADPAEDLVDEEVAGRAVHGRHRLADDDRPPRVGRACEGDQLVPLPVQADNALADAALAALQLPEEREVRDAAQRCGRLGADDDVPLAVDDLHGVAEPQRPQRRPQLVETKDAGDDAGEPVRAVERRHRENDDRDAARAGQDRVADVRAPRLADGPHVLAAGEVDLLRLGRRPPGDDGALAVGPDPADVVDDEPAAEHRVEERPHRGPIAGLDGAGCGDPAQVLEPDRDEARGLDRRVAGELPRSTRTSRFACWYPCTENTIPMAAIAAATTMTAIASRPPGHEVPRQTEVDERDGRQRMDT